MGLSFLSAYWRIFAPLLCAALTACGADVPPTVDASHTAITIAPYDENANAETELTAAINQASETGKLVLINFGANWCPDCREFEKACLEPETKQLIDTHFVVAKVDVGDWNKNPEIVAEWGNPIEGGIPAVVLATPDKRILFTTKAGQLSKARSMGQESLHRFLEHLASLSL